MNHRRDLLLKIWLPGAEALDLKCRSCGEMLSFIAQMYSPWDEYSHRVFYIFMCRKSTCNLQNTGLVKVAIMESYTKPAC